MTPFELIWPNRLKLIVCAFDFMPGPCSIILYLFHVEEANVLHFHLHRISENKPSEIVQEGNVNNNSAMMIGFDLIYLVLIVFAFIFVIELID